MVAAASRWLGRPPSRVIRAADPREASLVAALLARRRPAYIVCEVVEEPLRAELARPVDDAAFARAWALVSGAPPGPWALALPRPPLTASTWWLCGQVAVMVEPPLCERRDAAGRLHAADGPALAWPRFEVHAWHGVWLPPAWRGTEPEPLAVVALEDARLRRALIDKIGLARMLGAAPVRVVDRERDRALLRLDLAGDEPVVALEVRCPSTGLAHLLRVPPATRTCAEAVAWTFGLSESAFRPARET